MRKAPTLITDLSSVLKRCYFAGIDKEFGEEVDFNGRKVHVNSWRHGMEAFLNYMNKALRDLEACPMDVIFVLEGQGGTQIRRNIYPGYKQREERAPQVLEQYAKLQDFAVSYFKGMGTVSVKQDGVEADDVVAYLAKRLPGQIYVLMDDGDGLTLDNGDTVRVRYQSELIDRTKNPLVNGMIPVELNRLYKALVGDKSDTLPGAKGLGEAKFLDLYVVAQDEGMHELAEIIDKGEWSRLDADIAELSAAAEKPYQKAAATLKLMLEHKDVVRRCYQAAGFLEEYVNTPKNPLQWEGGICLEEPTEWKDDGRFGHWFQTRRLITSDNFAQLMASGIWAKIRQSPFITLDLEASVPPESDEWLRAINKQDEDDAPKGVDVIASKISGMGLTFGDNGQNTVYLTVDHKTDKNITPEQLYTFLCKVLEADTEIKIVVHNCHYELPVLFNNLAEWTAEDPRWDQGFLPRVEDSIFMASYVDENKPSGLKAQAELRLGYKQTSYEEVTWSEDEQRQRKMNEMTPQEVFAYGTDDTIATWGLRVLYGHIMNLEGTTKVFNDVEMDAAYLGAAGIVTGVRFSREEMRRQEAVDDKVYDAAWEKVRTYLIENKWSGVEMPEVTLETASIKEIFTMVTGEKLESKARTPIKLAQAMQLSDVENAADLGHLYEEAIKRDGDMTGVINFARQFHKGEPEINTDSPTQMTKLLYETMNLPQRVRNKPTPTDRKEGRKQGSLSTNALAFASAKFYDKEAFALEVEVLDALLLMRGVATRRKLYYRPYRYLRHHQTGMIHPSYGQCRTVTRRFAPAKPNLAQLPKDDKKGPFRACFLPHHEDAVVISLDFKAQELRVIADQSGDEVLTGCYVGDNRRDMHHLTGLSIAQKTINEAITYEMFSDAIADPDHEMHKAFTPLRKKGKTVNFASEYGAQGPKMAETLMVPLEQAEVYLAAKHETFWRAEEWKKDEVIPWAKKHGYYLTMLGGRRHLAEGFGSSEWGPRARAERQAVNFAIQGSCAEMTKLTMGRVWRAKMLTRYDAQFFAPIHDELVFSVHRDEAVAFVQELHPMMVAQYADMKIPLESSIGIGRNFKDLIEIGETPSTELILGALRKLFPGVEIAANDPPQLLAA